MKKLAVAVISCMILLLGSDRPLVHAESLEESNHTFTQPFQNTTTSLTGTSVRATMYFTKIDYWEVKNVTLNITYQITQLENEQNSDLTVAVNGVKFYSWRPAKTTEIQTETITVPLELIQGANTLTIEGQIVNKESDDTYNLIETPANWLTIYDGSNVNFQYDIKLPEDTIHSFYNHFVGADTVANQQSKILVSNPTEKELSAATYALAGVARIITTSENYLPIEEYSKDEEAPYQLIIATYDKLPEEYRSQIDEKDLDNQAVLKFFNTQEKHILVATSKNEDLLIWAGRYVANNELMTQTEKSEKVITEETDIFSSSLEFDGNYPLTSSGDKLVGMNHQEQVYYVNLPVDRNNANGSTVTLNFKYAKNLDFSSSLVTVLINDLPIGSKKLTANRADGDSLTLQFPDDLGIADSFVLKVAFDLNVENPSVLTNGQTPWALVENTSNAFIKTEELDDILFGNYPNMLIKGSTFSDIAVVLPDTMDKNYYQAITNLFNLIGNYAQSNVGEIEYYQETPKDGVLNSHNLLILGTPEDNSLIKKLNDKLFFQYDSQYQTFLSNEKLSIEEDYGKTIGTAQLMFSPYNSKATALVLTGTTSEAVYLASTQLNSEKSNGLYTGDAIVVDTDYRRYDYRFKKEASASEQNNLGQRIINNQQMAIYFILFLLAVVFFGLAAFFIVKKNNEREGQNE